MTAKPRKTKTPALSKDAALDAIRRIMRSTGFDEEDQQGDRIHFSSREGGDMENDRADPALVRFAREKAKEIETAVPGSKVHVETVDEWVSIAVALPGPGGRTQKPLKVGDAVEIPDGLGGALVGTIARIYNQGTSSESAEVHVARYAPSYHPIRTLKKTRKRPTSRAATTAPPPPPPTTPAAPQQRRHQPGDEIEYTNYTVGGSFKGKAIVTWDHGKSGVEARTLGGERLRLERAADGSLRRFT
jgi:hypothetical protein